MRILLAAKHAPEGKRQIGGVQSWCRTVKAELIRRGHEAMTWGPEQKLSPGKFDLGIIANIGDTRRVLDLCSRIIVICHGLIPAEKPPKDLPVAFTSEGLRDHWCMDGPIIRQPIDLDFWCPDDIRREWVTRYSYRRTPTMQPDGYPYRHIHKANHRQARRAIRSSLCVYATGRAALEAMACDIPTLIYDNRHYQGPLMGPRELKPNMENNFSGRGGFVPTQKDVDQETLVRIEEMDNPRAWVQKYHDVRDITDQLLV